MFSASLCWYPSQKNSYNDYITSYKEPPIYTIADVTRLVTDFIKELPHDRQLNLSSCRLTSDVIITLASILKDSILPDGLQINLHNSHLDKQSIPALVELFSLPVYGLTLDLTNNTLDENSITQLTHALLTHDAVTALSISNLTESQKNAISHAEIRNKHIWQSPHLKNLIKTMAYKENTDLYKGLSISHVPLPLVMQAGLFAINKSLSSNNLPESLQELIRDIASLRKY